MTRARDAPLHKDDLELMIEAARGTPSAQRTVATRLLTRAQWLASTILRQSSDAEDAAQTGVIEALRSAGDYRGEGPLERWADRIFARVAIKHAQAHRRQRERDVDIDDVELAAPPARSPVESDAAVEGYLTTLPDVCREAIVLRHVLEYSVPEIARLTAVSENTVKDRLLRGREMIRKRARQDEFLQQTRGAS